MANALKKLGEAALKPLYRDGSWRKPKCSARIAADLKKEALYSGRQEPSNHSIVPQMPKTLHMKPLKVCISVRGMPVTHVSHLSG